MASLPKKLRFWVIYQGPRAEAFAEKLRRLSAELEPSGVVLCQTRDTRHSAKGRILDRVLDDSHNLHGAIAIVDHVGKDASRSGNLWFEVGLWLAQRQHELLKICVKTKSEIISDLRGCRVAPFRTFDKLEAHIREHVDHVRAFYSSSPRRGRVDTTVGMRKIQETFLRPDQAWLRPTSYACHRSQRPIHCPFRLNSLEFAAELIRMEHASHERHTVEDYLSLFSGIGARLLLAQADGANSAGSMKDRDRLVGDMMRVREKFLSLIRSLLMKRVRPYPPPRWSVEQRFSRYVDDRLDTAVHCKIKPSSAIHEAHTQQQKGEDFLRWLKGINTKTWKAFITDNDTGFRGDLYLWTTYCGDVAEYLQAVNHSYFDGCRKVLNRRLGAKTSSRAVHEEFQKLIEEFPHNKKPYKPIWPQRILEEAQQ